MKLFSKMDLEFIQRALGRDPGKKELNILYKAVEPVLKLRDRIPARFISQEPTAVDHSLRYELREINVNGQWTGTHYLMRMFIAWSLAKAIILYLAFYTAKEHHQEDT